MIADVEHRIPLLCHFECPCILLYGRLCTILLHTVSTRRLSIFLMYSPFFLVFRGSSLLKQVCSWGGYTFIINLIPMHALLCIVTGRYSSRLYIAYAPLVSALRTSLCLHHSEVSIYSCCFTFCR